MTNPPKAASRWVAVVLNVLSLLVVGVSFLVLLALLTQFVVAVGWLQRPADVAIVGVLLLPILGWRLLFHVGRRIRHLPAVETRLRGAAAGRLLWPDIALGLTLGAAIAVASVASGLPWWARLLGVLFGCGIAAEVIATSAKIRRARSRRHPPA
jgi:hypothetical protein